MRSALRARLRRSLGAAVATVVTLATASAGVAVAVPAHAAGCPAAGGAKMPRSSASGDVVFSGHGWGHGLGMSQYGAQGAARLGCDAEQILTTYYTGTAITRAPMPSSLQVRMLDNGYRVDVEAQTGDVTWDLAGCTTDCAPVQPNGSTWQLRLDDSGTQYVLWDLGVTPKVAVWQGGSPDRRLRLRHSGTVVRLTTWKGSSIYLDRRLRWDWTRFGIVDAGAGTGRLDAVQVIEDGTYAGTTAGAMDKYLWGIAEVPASFPAEALKAQAIAARTFALKRAGRVLMPTPADQNYTGYAKESEGTDGVWGAKWKAAVDATSGRVVSAAATGALIDTFYSSSTGGHTEDERYVWGLESPFLRAVDDSRWDLASDNPAANRSWSKAVSWSSLAAKLKFDSITTISVPKRGAASRVAGVKVVGFRSGSRVTSFIEGWDVRQALGLLSPGFEISVRRVGGRSATPIAGDWDGDGTDQPGWFRSGNIALRMNDASGTWVKRYRYGKAGDVPVVGDWNGDGIDDVGIFRKGTWLLRNAQSNGAADLTFGFGRLGDRPVVGSWTGTTPGVGPGIGVVRKGRWLLRTTASAGHPDLAFRFGKSRDVPVAGDWNGDGTTTVGVVRKGRWLLRNRLRDGAASGGRATQKFRYRKAADRAVPGDWDGDGTSSAGAVHRRTFVLRNRAGGGKPSAVVPFRG